MAFCRAIILFAVCTTASAGAAWKRKAYAKSTAACGPNGQAGTLIGLAQVGRSSERPRVEPSWHQRGGTRS